MGMAKHDLITKDFALYVVHYFASMMTWSKKDILAEIDRTIKEAKPADPVEVVRCKACKCFMEYTKEYAQSVEGADGDCYIRVMNSDDKQFCACKYDDFCSYGERRTDNA